MCIRDSPSLATVKSGGAAMAILISETGIGKHGAKISLCLKPSSLVNSYMLLEGPPCHAGYDGSRPEEVDKIHVAVGLVPRHDDLMAADTCG